MLYYFINERVNVHLFKLTAVNNREYFQLPYDIFTSSIALSDTLVKGMKQSATMAKV
jgi:hypothetical protein